MSLLSLRRWQMSIQASIKAACRVYRTKNPPKTEYSSCQGRVYVPRGATLIHSMTCALSEIPAYLRQLTYAPTSRNTEPQPFPAPSVAHLAACISARLSPARTLCARTTALISTSTVYHNKIFIYSTILSRICQLFCEISLRKSPHLFFCFFCSFFRRFSSTRAAAASLRERWVRRIDSSSFLNRSSSRSSCTRIR